MKKKCSKCGRTRKLRFFNTDSRYRLGVKGWCKRCEREYHRTPEQLKAHKKRWHENMKNPEFREAQRIRSSKKYHRNPRRQKDYILRKLRGVSLKKHERTKRCLLCKRRVRLVADHNHKTNKYRGALCHICNLMVAWVERIPNALYKVRLYLRRS